MIGKLQGTLEYRGADHVMIMVGGVGYLVFCSDRTLAAMPAIGGPVSIYTDLLVREDLLQLFGFTTPMEKEWHRLLMGVQGIGAKASMAILGALGPEGLSRAIAMGDWASVKVAKGVGPKTAQKVVIDLKDKAPSVMAMGGPLTQELAQVPVEDEAVIETVAAPDMSAQAEALSALGNLGYSPTDAAGAVARAANEGADDTGALIKAALKLLAPKG